jgi:P2-related tail formation protein
LQIEQAMRGHVLANAELVGTYQKGWPVATKRQAICMAMLVRRPRTSDYGFRRPERPPA